MDDARRWAEIRRIAHDFGNLLSTVGALSHLVQPELEGEAAEDLAEIRALVERGGGLCEELLALGREGSAASQGTGKGDTEST